ncbi:hypothetical protein NHF46_02760 [Arthrobacter alpinus]|nr:hypothetical protein [Arthrobacter alpinus]
MIGFVFACIPGALILGWILLPIAFVLSLVSLFLKDKAKWMGITALLISIVGTIVGVAVFVSVLATSVDNAIGGGDTTVVQPLADAGAKSGAAQEKPASNAGTRENPHPIGSVIESDDWRVVVNSVTLAATDAVIAANSFNEPAAAGSEYIVVNYSATYLGDDPNGQMPAFVSIEYVTADGKPSTDSIRLSSRQMPWTPQARYTKTVQQQATRPLKYRLPQLAKAFLLSGPA